MSWKLRIDVPNYFLAHTVECQLDEQEREVAICRACGVQMYIPKGTFPLEKVTENNRAHLFKIIPHRKNCKAFVARALLRAETDND